MCSDLDQEHNNNDDDNNNNDGNNRIERRNSRFFYNLLTAVRTVSNTHTHSVQITCNTERS